MNVIAELRRRNVIRVAGLYLVAAWLLVQVCSTVLPVFDVPAWALRAVIVVLAIGFVPTLVIAWVFELTPQGLKRDADVAPQESIAPQTARRIDRTIIVVLACALAYFGVDKFALAPRRDAALVVRTTAQLAADANAQKSTLGARSIAVLPFVSMSTEADNGFFADGLSEEILNSLARIDGMQVVGRTSSFQFKGKNEDLRDVGQKLGVGNVLEGSVRRDGEHARITAQLIRTSDGIHLWSQTYDRMLTDTLAVQLDIAEQVAGVLDVVLDDGQRARMHDAGVKNVDAFIAYQRGLKLYVEAHRGELGKDAIDGLRIANVEFDKATALESRFADAYFAAADLYDHILLADDRSAMERADAQKSAMRYLDQAAGNSHDDQLRLLILADRQLVSDDWHGLPEQIEAALTHPGCVSPDWLPVFASAFGYGERIENLTARVSACDPLNSQNLTSRLAAALESGKPDRALAILGQADARTVRSRANGYRLQALLMSGETAKARAQLQEMPPDTESYLTSLAMVSRIEGDSTTVTQAKLDRVDRSKSVLRFWAQADLQVAAILGRRDEANRRAAAIDAQPAGPFVLGVVTAYCLCGAPFDLDATPNFKARLAEAGLPLATSGRHPVSGTRTGCAAVTFLSELKRRNVIRMAGLYLVGAWLVTQVAGTVLPMFGAPEWIARSVVILLAIGFIPALVIAWVFELTPQGLKRDADVAPQESIAPQTAQRMDRSIIVVLVLALLYFGIDKFVLAPQRDSKSSVDPPAATAVGPLPAVPAKSIAVLPFENLSKDEDNAYFANGMQDMILTKLAGIGDLKVISRTSTEKYKSRPDHLAVIASELGVASILEGSVQKSGNDVLINVQLIDAASDSHLWAEAYPRTLDNVFGVEGEVAQKVAEALHAALTRAERTRLALKPTQNAQALEAYLWALALEKDGTSQFWKASAELEKAVALDPAFTLAWTELVWKRLRDYWFGFDVTSANLEAAKSALDRAIALAPGQPEVDRASAQYLYYAKRDFAGARALMEKVQQGLPNDARTWLFTGFIERRAGAWEQAVAHFQQAQVLDPRDRTIGYELLTTAISRRRFDEVLDGVEVHPGEVDDDSVRELELFARWNVGGLDAGDRMLSTMKALTPGTLAMRATQAFFRRDYATASALFDQAIADAGKSSDIVQSEFFVGGYLPVPLGWELRRALSEQKSGSIAKAMTSFTDVQVKANDALKKGGLNPNAEAAWHAVAALAAAGLGQNDASIAEARKAVQLIPESTDAFEGPYWQDYLAQAYAMHGDAAHALPLIERLSRTAGSMTTIAMLKLDPVWDPIRNDPRLQRLLSAPATATARSP